MTTSGKSELDIKRRISTVVKKLLQEMKKLSLWV